MTRQEAIIVMRDTNWSRMMVDWSYADRRRVLDAIIASLAALRVPEPNPDTGLIPCGCGGKAKIWLSDFTRVTYLITDYEVGCTECAMTTGWVRGKQENAVKVWNTAMGCPDCGRPLSGNPEQEGF